LKPAEGSTFLTKSFTVRGEITGAEELYIDGVIEGTVTLRDSRVTIGANAVIKADLEVQDAVLLGKLEGNITATGKVELRQTAVLLGNVTAARLSVEDSAAMRGQVLLTGSE
jgi:cytoskeletal protein CcmA (bactofilin family)